MNGENNGLLILKDEDGFPCLREGVKDYTLIRYKIYKVIFSTWTSWWKDRANWLGYLDLTAGPGYSQTEGLKKLKKQVGASPIIAVETTPPFTHFIFIEKDHDSYDALRKRMSGRVNCRIYLGDANNLVRSALLELKGRCLACVDPFKPSDITWSTVSELLQEGFCDVVGVLPAPLTQRSVGRFIERYYIRSLRNHMPPSFNLKEVKKIPRGKLAAYCRYLYTNHMENEFKRSVFTCYIKDAKYQVLFATTEHGLKEKIKNQVKSLALSGVEV